MLIKTIYLIAHICLSNGDTINPTCVSLSDWHDTKKDCLRQYNEIESILLDNNIERNNYELQCI
jgi:hypothetical protein